MADDKTFTKDELDAAVEKAVGALDVDGLKAKIEELIGDNKKLKTDLRAKSEVKPEDVHAAEERADKAEAALAEAVKAAKEATKLAEKAVKDLETEQGFTQKLLISDGIKSALIANGVKDETYIDDLTNSFASRASVKVDGDARVAMIGDKLLDDHFKEWAGTEAGKKYIAAPDNSGGGGRGGGNKPVPKTMLRSRWDELGTTFEGQAERSAFSKEGGKVVDEAA